MNVITTTGSDVLSSTHTPRRRPRLSLYAAGALVLAGGTTAAVVSQPSHPTGRPATTINQLQQDRATKADRLLAPLDAAAPTDQTVMVQIHQVTGENGTAQQARTRLYQELRDHTDQ